MNKPLKKTPSQNFEYPEPSEADIKAMNKQVGNRGEPPQDTEALYRDRFHDAISPDLTPKMLHKDNLEHRTPKISKIDFGSKL